MKYGPLTRAGNTDTSPDKYTWNVTAKATAEAKATAAADQTATAVAQPTVTPVPGEPTVTPVPGEPTVTPAPTRTVTPKASGTPKLQLAIRGPKQVGPGKGAFFSFLNAGNAIFCQPRIIMLLPRYTLFDALNSTPGWVLLKTASTQAGQLTAGEP